MHAIFKTPLHAFLHSRPGDWCCHAKWSAHYAWHPRTLLVGIVHLYVACTRTDKWDRPSGQSNLYLLLGVVPNKNIGDRVTKRGLLREGQEEGTVGNIFRSRTQLSTLEPLWNELFDMWANLDRYISSGSYNLHAYFEVSCITVLAVMYACIQYLQTTSRSWGKYIGYRNVEQ